MAKTKNEYVSYAEKLRDPRWQQMRLRIMERDGFACKECGDTGTTLNVHHIYYERGKDPWDYPEDAFQTLCEPHHKEVEELRREISAAMTTSRDHERVKDFLDVIHNQDLNGLMGAISEFLVLRECAITIWKERQGSESTLCQSAGRIMMEATKAIQSAIAKITASSPCKAA